MDRPSRQMHVAQAVDPILRGRGEVTHFTDRSDRLPVPMDLLGDELGHELLDRLGKLQKSWPVRQGE